MQLDGPQRGALREALFDAFTYFTFQQMVEERIVRRYSAYVPVSGTFPEMLFSVIGAANREATGHRNRRKTVRHFHREAVAGRWSPMAYGALQDFTRPVA